MFLAILPPKFVTQLPWKHVQNMLMANIEKGVQKITSLEENKGTMNSEYFGFMSRDEIQ